MKKVFLVLPLAILLANCSSTRNSNGTASNSGMNASTGTTASSSVNSDASTSSSTLGSTASATGSMNNSTSNSANWNSNNNSTVKNSSAKTSSGSINWDVYDPNNYMQNPDKYRKPYEIAKAGGWTYSKDWRRNTNFTADAVGEWQLTITPEVASYWMPDTRRPETYASFWTPEAVMARYQARVAAILKTQDSLAAINAANENMASNGSKSISNGNALASTTTSDNSAATSTTVTGSGSTGAMGTGGTSSTTSDSSANSSVTTPFLLTAVNGNNYLLPKLNLYIDNGSFTAYTGCNNALGKIIVDGSTLHFEETTPSSNIECIGGFDQSAFLDRLRRADSYDVVNNQFRIKQGDQVLMTFQKNAPKL